MEQGIAETIELIAESKHLVVFTGAGISTESGLPDYRGPEGVWTLRDKGLKPKLPKIPWSEVEPNAAHLAVVELQEMGLMKFLISQNVDGLHLKSGINPELIAELHGNSTLVKCLNCDHRFSKRETGWNDRLHGRGYRTSKAISGQPVCPSCGGRLISSVVNFNDPMPEKEMEEAKRHSELSDVYLVIGSTLLVTPAADMPVIAQRNGAKLIIINKGETAMDHLAYVRLEGKAGEILPLILQGVRERMEKSKNTNK